MIIDHINYNGVGFQAMTPDELLDAGVPEQEVNKAVDAAMLVQKRSKVRSTIAAKVADTPSLVGTVADSVGVLIAVALADIVALSNATDFAKYKKAKFEALSVIAGETDVVALATDALGKIQSGEVVLTASLKGLDGVITESLVRSTVVATILKQAAETMNAEGE